MGTLTTYVNGDFVPAKKAALPLNDLGIVRGYGVFDLLRTYGPPPLRWSDNKKLRQSEEKKIELELRGSKKKLKDVVLKKNKNNEIANSSIPIIVPGGPSKRKTTRLTSSFMS